MWKTCFEDFWKLHSMQFVFEPNRIELKVVAMFWISRLSLYKVYRYLEFDVLQKIIFKLVFSEIKLSSSYYILIRSIENSYPKEKFQSSLIMICLNRNKFEWNFHNLKLHSMKIIFLFRNSLRQNIGVRVRLIVDDMIRRFLKIAILKAKIDIDSIEDLFNYSLFSCKLFLWISKHFHKLSIFS